MTVIEPTFRYELPGFVYLGRGPGGRGWSREKCYYYRCAKCGDMMWAASPDYFDCKCKAMNLDVTAGRFASDLGDQNILRYQKIDPEALDSLMQLWPGACIEVINEFRDYDEKAWTVGTVLRGFKEYNCVPYHGGYTFVFENGSLRFSSDVPENVGVFSHFQQYFRVSETVLEPRSVDFVRDPASSSSSTTVPTDALKKRCKIVLWIATIIMLIVTPALLAALVMSLAAPGGASFKLLVPMILTAAPFALIIAGWIMYGRKQYFAATILAGTQVVLFLLFVVLSTAATLYNSVLGFPNLKTTIIEQPQRQK